MCEARLEAAHSSGEHGVQVGSSYTSSSKVYSCRVARPSKPAGKSHIEPRIRLQWECRPTGIQPEPALI